MAIDFNLLKQALPNFSGESLLQHSLQSRAQGQSALQQALQLQSQQAQRATQMAIAGKQQQVQQGAQANVRRGQDMSVKLAIDAQRQKEVAAKRAYKDQQVGRAIQNKTLDQQQQQHMDKLTLDKDKIKRDELFNQAYLGGDQAAMAAIDPEKFLKIKNGQLKVSREELEAKNKVVTDQINAEDKLYKQFDAATKPHQAIMRNYAKFIPLKKNLFDKNTRVRAASQVSLVYTVAKMYDEGGRVTDKDFDAVAGASGDVKGWLDSMEAKLTSGGTMSDDQVNALLQIVEGNHQAYSDQYQQLRQEFIKKGNTYGLNVENIAPDRTPASIAIEQKRKEEANKPLAEKQAARKARDAKIAKLLAKEKE